MKMQVRSEDTHIFYPLATWSWKKNENILVQRIPKITEVRFHIPGNTKTPVITIPEHMIQPSLQIGQEVRLDDTTYYVANVEPLPPDGFQGTIYVYYMSEMSLRVPAFWNVDVIEE